MLDCNVAKERMPLLIGEALDSASREETHQHIERCSACELAWGQLRETWRRLGELPEVALPPRARQRFDDYLANAAGRRSNVVSFPARRPLRWIAQVAAAAVLVTGSFVAGREISKPKQPQATMAAATAKAPLQLGGDLVLPASAVTPAIESRPEIQNVQFLEPSGAEREVGVAFDITSRVTVKGDANDKAFVNLVSYVLSDPSRSSHARSAAMQWVKNTYNDGRVSDPRLVTALATILKTEPQEGVRLKAVETLRSIGVGSEMPAAQSALIEALKNDPNPAVRIKAVEALMNLAKSGSSLDRTTVDILRAKAGQEDENPYVRVKAAEALNQIDL